jgi:hypothetical protein
MAEEITLTTPQTVSKTTNDFKVYSLLLMPTQLKLTLVLVGTQGQYVEFRREGSEAQTIFGQLNTSNNSVTSLAKRVMQWAMSQPEAAAAGITGTVTGTPEQ